MCVRKRNEFGRKTKHGSFVKKKDCHGSRRIKHLGVNEKLHSLTPWGRLSVPIRNSKWSETADFKIFPTTPTPNSILSPKAICFFRNCSVSNVRGTHSKCTFRIPRLENTSVTVEEQELAKMEGVRLSYPMFSHSHPIFCKQWQHGYVIAEVIYNTVHIHHDEFGHVPPLFM